ncbi:MAG: 30S ribosomal protein S9 [Candidatus Aenigmarchaeota archaeon]|nr:30S ribosomal protein S9 [Candidatus Aenigmarchaeota archaeon]
MNEGKINAVKTEVKETVNKINKEKVSKVKKETKKTVNKIKEKVVGEKLERRLLVVDTDKKPVKSKSVKKKKLVNNIYVGKRKRAIARVSLTQGDKKITINNKSIEEFPKVAQLKISEPLIIAEEDNYNIKVNVKGGGVMGQAEAIAQGIAKALVKLKGESLKKKLIAYDRNLLIQDIRRTEPHKPSCSKRGPRAHKQRSKR